MGGRRDGWAGLQKLITDLDMRNGYNGGPWVSSIDMYNNDVGQESAQNFMKHTGDLSQYRNSYGESWGG